MGIIQRKIPFAQLVFFPKIGAERIGLLPGGFAAKVKPIGNAAGAGASMVLLSETMRKIRGVQPLTSATPCSLLVTGCCVLRLWTFQNTIRGSRYPQDANRVFAFSKTVASAFLTQ